MPRLILRLRPGARTAAVSQQASTFTEVVGTTEAQTVEAVIVDVTQISDDLKRRLAELPSVERVEEDIQAVPQVADDEAVKDFLDRVKAIRGEEHVPPPVETKPVRRDDVRTDGGRVTLPGPAQTDAPTPGPQATIQNVDDSLQFLGADQLHADGIRGESVIAVTVDGGACGDVLRDERKLAGADLTDQNDPYTHAYEHGPYVTGIMAGDDLTPGITLGYLPDADIFPIKSTLAGSELIEAQDIIVQLAEDTGKPVVVNNCLTADAMVSTADGPKPIVDVEVGDQVYACDVDVRGQRVCEVTDTFESGEKEVYDLRTRTRSVRASDNHPFLVADQDQQRLVWKALEDLAPGDLIAIRRENTAGAGKPHRFVEADGGQATLSGGPDVRLDGKTSSKGCKVPKETTREFCQLLGALYGDGSVTYSTSNKNRVLFTTNLEKYPGMNWYVEAFERVFGVDWIERPKRGEQGAATAFVVNNKPLADFLHRNGLKVGKDRELPEWLYSVPQDQQLAFLRGYVDADGHVDKRGQIHVRSTHGDLVRQVWEMFVAAGVKVTRVKKQVQDIEVEPSGNFYEDHEVFHFTASCLADNRRIGSELSEYTKRLAPVREKPMDYDYVDQWTPVMDGFVFDRVVEIEAAGIEPTYDIEVAGAHNFVANGILLHNSWGFVECEGLCGLTVTEAIANASTHPLVYQVFAAGNQATGDADCGELCDGTTVGIAGPNSLNSVITVAATGNDGNTDTIQPYSSRGGPDSVSCGQEKPDLTAPIFGTVPWGCTSTDIGNSGGTSGATPQVAGAIGLVLDAAGQPVAQQDLFGTARDTALQFQGSGFNGCTGWGHVQPVEAADVAPTAPIEAGFGTSDAVILAVALGFTGAIIREAWLRQHA